jgi:hypothetical protein
MTAEVVRAESVVEGGTAVTYLSETFLAARETVPLSSDVDKGQYAVVCCMPGGFTGVLLSLVT